MRKLVSCLLAALICIFPLASLAGDIDAVLTTDSSSYTRGEPVTVQLKVTNNTLAPVFSLALALDTPAGFLPADGSPALLQAGTLTPGESAVLTASFVPGDTAAPATGDRMPLAVLLCAMLASALIAAVVLRMKAAGMLMLVMCATLACSGAAQAEEIKLQTVTASGSFIYDGAAIDLSASVTYDPVGEISYVEPSADHIKPLTGSSHFYVDNELLLVAELSAERAQIEALVAEYGGRVIAVIELTGDYQVEFDQVRTYAELEALAKEFKKSDLIFEAMPNVSLTICADATPNDTEWLYQEWSTAFPEGLNWGMEAIDAMGAWEYRSRMQTINVGVIDGCFSRSNNDLSFAQIWNYVEPSQITDLEGDPNHGTHVAGIIGAGWNNGRGIAGVAPNVRLYAYALDSNTVRFPDGKGNENTFMQLKYALAVMATKHCRVINISMSFPDEPERLHARARVMGEHISRLRNGGYDFLIVQSAGNSAVEAAYNSFFTFDTSNQDRIIVVGNIGTNGSSRLGGRKFKGYYYASDSNYGSRVDVVAPGQDILSTFSGNKYEELSGTSMSTPHVSGIAAMIYGINPGLTAPEVKQMIVQTCWQEEIARTNDVRTYPLVNANAAVARAMASAPGSAPSVNSAVVLGAVYTDISCDDHPLVAAYWANDPSNLATAVFADISGGYTLTLQPGEYILKYSLNGFASQTFTATVRANQTMHRDDVVLSHIPMGKVGIHVYDSLTRRWLSGVQVTFLPDVKAGNGLQQHWSRDYFTFVTDENGAVIEDVPVGKCSVVLQKRGYKTKVIELDVMRGMNEPQSMELAPDVVTATVQLNLNDSQTNDAVPYARVTFYPGAKQNSVIPSDYAGSITTSTNLNGISTATVPLGDCVVIAERGNYDPLRIYLNITSSCAHTFQMKPHGKIGLVEINVKDANTSAALADVKVTIYPGLNNPASIPEQWPGKLTGYTSNKGMLRIKVPAGECVIVLEKTGYSTTFVYDIIYEVTNDAMTYRLSPSGK